MVVSKIMGISEGVTAGRLVSAKVHVELAVSLGCTFSLSSARDSTLITLKRSFEYNIFIVMVRVLFYDHEAVILCGFLDILLHAFVGQI